MLNKYWYKVVGTSASNRQTSSEGGLSAPSAEQALSVMKAQLKTWTFTKVTCLLIYDVDVHGELSAEPVLMEDFNVTGYSTTPAIIHYPVTKTEPKESIADKYENADWLTDFNKPEPFNIVRIKGDKS